MKTIKINDFDVKIDHDDNIKKKFLEDFNTNNYPTYLFGCNKWAQSIKKNYKVDGFIDDFIKNNSFLDKPVIKSSEIPKNALVVSCIVGIKPISSINFIKKKNIRVIDYFSFKRYSIYNLEKIMNLDGFQMHFEKKKSDYEKLFFKLKDEKSKTTLLNIINFRINYDICYLEGFKDSQSSQYFEPFLNLKKNNEEVFVDVGSYDGFTSEKFIEECDKKIKSIHIIEPSPKNMDSIKLKFNNNPRVHYYQFAAYNKTGESYFSLDRSSSKLTNEGKILVNLELLDNLIKDDVTYIKFDIEGAEYEALIGAKNLIKQKQPRLAVSVYHKAEDILKLFNLIISINDKYNIYLRHYTEGVTETVMFFIPK